MKKNNGDKLTSQVKDKESNHKSTRRHFLKKTVYSAPSLLALGQMIKPPKAHADNIGEVAANPNWGDGW